MTKREDVSKIKNLLNITYEDPLKSVQLHSIWYNVHCNTVQWTPDCGHPPSLAAQHNTRSAHTALCAFLSCLL